MCVKCLPALACAEPVQSAQANEGHFTALKKKINLKKSLLSKIQVQVESVFPDKPVRTPKANVKRHFTHMHQTPISQSESHICSCLCAGLVVVTDGCLGVPDTNLFEFLLTQLRTSTIACSFLRLGEDLSPFGHFGHIPHVELMQFIATATFGSYFDNCPDVVTVSLLFGVLKATYR